MTPFVLWHSNCFDIRVHTSENMDSSVINRYVRLSDLNGNEYVGLLFKCSVNEGFCSCTFEMLRKLPVINRISAWQSFSNEERDSIVKEHQKCIEKEVNNQFQNIGDFLAKF